MLLAASLVPASPASTLYESRLEVSVQFDESAIQTGDLVFRRGRSWLSRAVVEADPASSFSHVGLAVVEEGRVTVVHATPGDRETEAGVVAEPLLSYLSASSATSAAVFRVGDAALAAQAAGMARDWARQSVPFDGAFEAGVEDSADEALYCTELVWKAYLRAGLDLLDGELDRVDLPLGPDLYILPSSLLHSAHVAEVEAIQPTTIPGRDS